MKIAATTLGETGGDTLTMTLNWGYLVGTAIFFSLLVILVVFPDSRKEIQPGTLLGDDRGFDHGGHDLGRLCRPFLGRRVRGRFVDSVSVPDHRSCELVLVAWVHFRHDGDDAKS
jgi:hypothetical protein